MRAEWTTVLLLAASNVFMTIAWYGHLKNLRDRRLGLVQLEIPFRRRQCVRAEIEVGASDAAVDPQRDGNRRIQREVPTRFARAERYPRRWAGLAQRESPLGANHIVRLDGLQRARMTECAFQQVGSIRSERGDIRGCDADIQVNRRARDRAERLIDLIGDHSSAHKRSA